MAASPEFYPYATLVAFLCPFITFLHAHLSINLHF
jgi:hypothetical protein